MPLTLAELQVEMQDAVSKLVIDEFRRSNYVLDNLPFDDTAYPDANGYSWTYKYYRLTTRSGATTRAVNTEFPASEAKTTPFTVQLAILGGAFTIDRTQVNTSVLGDRLALQLQEKIKETQALFNDLFINGDTGTQATAFDGLDKALTGSITEYNAGKYIDLSDSNAIDANYKAFLDIFEEWLSALDGTPSAILGNTKVIARIRAIARRSGYHSLSEDAFGRPVTAYNGIPLIDLGDRPSGGPVVPIETRNIDANSVSGLTDIYAVRFGLDGVHGVAPQARRLLISTYLPPMDQPGAVKRGEVEMVTAVALKSTRAAGVFRNVKVM